MQRISCQHFIEMMVPARAVTGGNSKLADMFRPYAMEKGFVGTDQLWRYFVDYEVSSAFRPWRDNLVFHASADFVYGSTQHDEYVGNEFGHDERFRYFEKGDSLVIVSETYVAANKFNVLFLRWRIFDPNTTLYDVVDSTSGTTVLVGNHKMHRGNYVVLEIPRHRANHRFSGYVERWLSMEGAMRRGRTVKPLLEDPVYQAFQLAQFARPWRFSPGALPTVVTIQRWFRKMKGLIYTLSAECNIRSKVRVSLKTFMSDFLAHHVYVPPPACGSYSTRRQTLQQLPDTAWASVLDFLDPGEALVGIASAWRSMRVVFMRLSAQPGAAALHLFRARFQVSAALLYEKLDADGTDIHEWDPNSGIADCSIHGWAFKFEGHRTVNEVWIPQILLHLRQTYGFPCKWEDAEAYGRASDFAIANTSGATSGVLFRFEWKNEVVNFIPHNICISLEPRYTECNIRVYRHVDNPSLEMFFSCYMATLDGSAGGECENLQFVRFAEEIDFHRNGSWRVARRAARGDADDDASDASFPSSVTRDALLDRGIQTGFFTRRGCKIFA